MINPSVILLSAVTKQSENSYDRESFNFVFSTITSTHNESYLSSFLIYVCESDEIRLSHRKEDAVDLMVSADRRSN